MPRFGVFWGGICRDAQLLLTLMELDGTSLVVLQVTKMTLEKLNSNAPFLEIMARLLETSHRALLQADSQRDYLR